MSERTLITIWTGPTCAPCKVLKMRLGITPSDIDGMDKTFPNGMKAHIICKDVLAHAKEAEGAGIMGVPTIVISDSTGVKETLVGAPLDVLTAIEKWL